ncbi:hypothetical protein K501DRAFT_280449, partial [Backusella circina FSU 941]
FNKCKSYIENGDRLEYMSWRLWQYQRKNNHCRKEEEKNDNGTLFQPSAAHDAYPHEVPQPFQKCHPSTIHNHEKRLLIEWTPPTDEPILSLSSYDKTRQQAVTSHCSSRDVIIPCTSLRMITPPLEENQLIEKGDIDNDDVDYEDDDDFDDDYDDDDYFLSDDDYDDDDEVNYSIVVNEFKKTQPRPATPRRSLLSDLLQKQCSPHPSRSPSNQYLSPSSSTTSFEQDLSQSLRDSLHRESWFSSDGEQHITNQVTVHKKPRNDPSESRWLESFHGW